MRQLREIAHSRTGDKGDTSNISVIAYDAKDYPLPGAARHGGARAGALRRPRPRRGARATSCPASAR